MKAITAGIVLATTTMGASAGGLLIGEYQLGDHPNGNQNPPPYGLRLDNVLGSGIATLSIGYHNDTVLQVYDDGGDLSIHISGTLHGGLVNGSGGYVSAADYSVDFSYSVGVSASGGGWIVTGFDAANMGTLTNLDTNDTIDLYAKGMPDTFLFLPDDHRLDTDANDWVGRGWLTDQSDGSDPLGGTRDWLFTATEIPAPSALALMGLGGLVSTRRRR
jgi:uncharacterized protein (TIGR03382 family)